MYKKIVVGTDLSTTAGAAVARASVLSERLGADLHLVHVGPPSDELDELARRADARPHAVSGSPAEALLGETERLEADLLVVGSVGMSGARRFMLGNVPNKVSHHANTDLLIVKTDRPRGKPGEIYRKVLVGTDGSPTATRAVRMASAVTKALDAKATIVTAYEPPSEHELKRLREGTSDAIGAWEASRTQRQTPEEFRWRIAGASQAEDVLERAEDCATEMGVTAEVRALEGAPAQTLLDLAENEGFDLVAVGSVGMTGPKRFMLGNVPHRLSHHTPTDILILHTE